MNNPFREKQSGPGLCIRDEIGLERSSLLLYELVAACRTRRGIEAKAHLLFQNECMISRLESVLVLLISRRQANARHNIQASKPPNKVLHLFAHFSVLQVCRPCQLVKSTISTTVIL